MLPNKLSDSRSDLRPEARPVEDAIMAHTLLKVIEFLVGGQVGRQVEGRERLADARNVVPLALDRHDGAAADRHQVDGLVPVHHLALGQFMPHEHLVDGLEIEFGRQVHDGEIFVVEIPVLLGANRRRLRPDG